MRVMLDSEAYAEDHRRGLSEALDGLSKLGFDPQEAERLSQEHLRMQEGLRSLDRELSQGTISLQSRESALQRDLKDARDAGVRIGPVRQDLAAVAARIESGDFAGDARGEVTKAERGDRGAGIRRRGPQVGAGQHPGSGPVWGAAAAARGGEGSDRVGPCSTQPGGVGVGSAAARARGD